MQYFISHYAMQSGTRYFAMVEEVVKEYKKIYDRELRHIKVMMMSKKSTMPKNVWLNFVASTKQSILNNPHNFVRSIPDKQTFTEAIELVFHGFLEDQKIRDVQKKFRLG